MDVFHISDYREILRQELARRMKQNPRYSQGAFARDLDITPGRLSEILHGKQGLSPNAANDIAKHLRLPEEQKHYFLDLITLAHGRSRVLRENARIRLLRYRKLPQLTQLNEESFRSISDWYHMAILEMAQMPRQARDAAGIAQQLGIHENVAKDALERLQGLGLLTGTGEANDRGQRFVGTLNSEPFQNFGRQILSKAIEALDDKRVHSTRSFLISLSQKRLAELVQLIDQTSEQIADLLIRADVEEGDKNALYCLSLQFFPLFKDPFSQPSN